MNDFPKLSPEQQAKIDQFMESKKKLEDSLRLKRDLFMNDEEFCIELYCALCNVEWFHEDVPLLISWRTAGGLIADVVDNKDGYLAYYCSGIGSNNIHEGIISERVRDLMKSIGYTPNERHVQSNLGNYPD